MLCPKCGVSVQDGRQSCFNCGAYLTFEIPKSQDDQFNKEDSPRYYQYIPLKYRQPDFNVPVKMKVFFYFFLILSILGIIVNLLLLIPPPTDIYGNPNYTTTILGFIMAFAMVGYSIRLYNAISTIQSTGYINCGKCGTRVNPNLDFCPNCNKKFSYFNF